MIPSNGICPRTGVYRSAACEQDVVGRAGAPMPVCPKCGKATEWFLVAALSPMVKASVPPRAAAPPAPHRRRKGGEH